MKNLYELVVLIKGAGEVASGIAHRLHRSHLNICLTETPYPLAVSRGTSYCEAVWDRTKTIEEVTAILVPNTIADITNAWHQDKIPLLIDPDAAIRQSLQPDVIVDASMTKKRYATQIHDAPLVIGIGPGFIAGNEVHMVVETFQDNNLGKVLYKGEALANNGLPVEIGGLGKERVIWATSEGVFTTNKQIGDYVESGEVIAYIGKDAVKAPLKGWLRGLLRSNVSITRGTKLIEVDHVNDNSIANDIRNKMRAIAGGVLEAIMVKFNEK